LHGKLVGLITAPAQTAWPKTQPQSFEF